MITLAAASTLQGGAGSAASITCTIFGDELTTVDSFRKLYQGQLPSSPGVLYTVPASTTALIKSILMVNTSGGAVTASLYVDGTAAANRLCSLPIPAGGEAVWAADGWKLLDAAGALLTSTSSSVPNTRLISTTAPLTGGGDLSADRTLALTTSPAGQTPVGVTRAINTTAPLTGGGDLSADRTLALTTSPASQTPVGVTRAINTTAPITGGGDLSADRTLALTTSPAGQTPVGVTRTLTLLSPLTIAGVGSADLSVDRTIQMPAVTTTTNGYMGSADKLKLDNLWIDVTANSIAIVNPANSAATNSTLMNILLAGAPNGSTIFFPPGRYDFNAAWTMPNKMFSFLGRGSNRAGSPATAFTELRWTSNVAGTLITLPGSGNGWYTTFRNLTFTTSVDQTVGSVVDANGNVGINFDECAFQSNGGFFLDVITYGGGAGSNSGNSTSINGCNIQGFKGNGVLVNAAGSSLTITDSVIQGQWGTTAQAATSCVRGKWVGALQLLGCDILGAANNMLLDPTAASSEVCASVQCTNTYFDSSFGSSFKVAGTGATVRLKMDTCTFTTNTGGTAFSAVELAGSNVYAAGAQDLAFVNCNIYNTFGTTGATNGVLITNVADVSFTNCKVAGWATGVAITPMASNKTNVQIIGGTIGPSGGYGANTTGINVGAGAYKGLQVRGCNVIGNTTNLTLGAVTVLANEGSLYAITECAGINPRGSVGTIAVPGTGVAQVNTTGFRCIVVQRFTVVPTGYAINGVATVLPIATSVFTLTVEPGGSVTTTGGTYTWTWVGQ